MMFYEFKFEYFNIVLHIIDMQNDYSELSKSLTEGLSEEVKKKQGIFFSPQKSIIRCVNYINNILKHDYTTVLEPSCGSCEFINYLDKQEGLNITGIEYNEQIFETIKSISFRNHFIPIHGDFLDYETTQKYDLIIGNPPYFVIPKNKIDKKYHPYIAGRPNIFLVFIIKSLALLSDNGILAFILPKSFLNCSYYTKVREYIYHNFHVKKIMDCSDDEYIETQQDTFILILKKTKKKFSNDKYFIPNNLIMNTENNIKTMKKITKDSTTLHQMGFEVLNGNFVWNQERTSLTNNTEDVRLLYCGDIIGGKLRTINTDDVNERWDEYHQKMDALNDLFKNDETNEKLIKKKKTLLDKIEKKHYVISDKHPNKQIEGVSLIINRGYGNTVYTLDYALVELDKYYLENHVLVIKYSGDISNEELKDKYEMVINSFKSEKTKTFVDLCMGNNAMNTTELEYLLPIFE